MDNKKEIQLKEKIVRAIKTVYDPEIPVDVYELGLIYEINLLPKKNVQKKDMSLLTASRWGDSMKGLSNHQEN